MHAEKLASMIESALDALFDDIDTYAHAVLRGHVGSDLVDQWVWWLEEEDR